MGRILWEVRLGTHRGSGSARFNPLTNGADIVGTTRQWSGVSRLWSFNPLTNGADIVGFVDRLVTVLVVFQSPDQWGGYCGLDFVLYSRGENTGFNPLTNGADIVGSAWVPSQVEWPGGIVSIP